MQVFSRPDENAHSSARSPAPVGLSKTAAGKSVTIAGYAVDGAGFPTLGPLWAEATRIGGDEAIVLSYRQIAGEQHVTVFAGRQIICLPLQGRVFLRRSDGPLHVTMQPVRVENGAVDYTTTPHGSLAPASVLHRSIDGGTVVAENRFRYAAFRKFGAPSEVKFLEVPEVK